MKKQSVYVLGAGVLALALTGCGSNAPTAEQSAAPVESRSGVGVNQYELGANGLPRALSDPKNILSKRSVFFDLDSFVIKGEYRDLVAAHAQFLVQNPKHKILIQGNTDERGSREYNLALGQKRADALKKALSLLGVSEAQIESVSLGEEKPRSEGSDEAAWAENRRADILYQGEF